MVEYVYIIECNPITSMFNAINPLIPNPMLMVHYG